MEDNIITLQDESGNDVEFELLDLINYENEDYIALLPAGDELVAEGEDGEVLFLKVDAICDDDISYISVENEETLTALFQIFKDRHKDNFNFLD